MNPKPLDHINVIDVEATRWNHLVPSGQSSDIIEIGIAVLNMTTLDTMQNDSLTIRPRRSGVGAFCPELTTLTPKQVDSGCSFEAACTRLCLYFSSRDRIWASYGDHDRLAFERQCVGLSVPYPFGSRHLNVKTLFALKYRLPKEVGMAQALEIAGLPLIGTYYRAKDDAANIARLLATLLAPRGDNWT